MRKEKTTRKKADRRTDRRTFRRTKAIHPKRRHRQDRLPGVETDPGSSAIDNAAYAYVEARDAMQEATKFVHKQEEKLLAVLKHERPGKKAYKHGVGGETIMIQIVAKDPTEKAKVKIQAEDAGDTATADDGDVTSQGDPEDVGGPEELDDEPF